jgi:ribonuclease T1
MGSPASSKSNRGATQWLRMAIVLAVLGIGLYGAWQREADRTRVPDQSHPGAENASAKPEGPADDRPPATGEEAIPSTESSSTSGRNRIAQQTILDQDGEVVFRGTVDVGPTLARIQRGQRLRFSHDGSVFQNRERRLPQKPAGYYREFVHPTPGLDGPGPQRIVRGQNGETYYTPDHYRTFQRLDE